MPRLSRFLCLALLPLTAAAAPAGAEAMLVLMSDQHSAYERTAQVVAGIDRLQEENRGLPMAILINGDSLELGNVIAQRSGGVVDFAMLAFLARRAPTILNLGNHEPEFYDLAETVRRAEEAGVRCISNIMNRRTDQPFAPVSLNLRLGSIDTVVVGIATNSLSTYRAAVRPMLDVRDPVIWGRRHLPELLRDARLAVVLSHAGVGPDRELLPLVPDGTLFAGGHNHLRFVHREGRTAYVHSGSWNECLTVAWLCPENGEPRWEIEQIQIDAGDPAEPRLAEFIRATTAEHLTRDDLVRIGRLPEALPVFAAGRFAAAAVRRAANTDAALIANTTFGAGLPAGDISRRDFDACIRFDGTIFVGDVDGAELARWLAGANQGPETPWSNRRGEFLFAEGVANPEPGQRYRVAISDWVARNAPRYLGRAAPDFTERNDLKLKAIVIGAMER